MHCITSFRQQLIQRLLGFWGVKLLPLPSCRHIDLKVVKKEPPRLVCRWIVETLELIFKPTRNKLPDVTSGDSTEASANLFSHAIFNIRFPCR